LEYPKALSKMVAVSSCAGRCARRRYPSRRFEVKPRSAVGNDARRVEDLTAGVSTAFVMGEECARGAVELAYHDALGAIHDECSVLGHEREVADIHFLLLDVLDPLGAGLLVLLEEDEADLDLERSGKGRPALQTFQSVYLGSPSE